MRPLKSVLIHSVGWHLSELLDLIPPPIDYSGNPNDPLFFIHPVIHKKITHRHFMHTL